MGKASPKTTIDTNTHKKRQQPKHNTKEGHLTAREENKRGREENRPTKANGKHLRKWQQECMY